MKQEVLMAGPIDNCGGPSQLMVCSDVKWTESQTRSWQNMGNPYSFCVGQYEELVDVESQFQNILTTFYHTLWMKCKTT
jgi:hypothetical protein